MLLFLLLIYPWFISVIPALQREQNGWYVLCTLVSRAGFTGLWGWPILFLFAVELVWVSLWHRRGVSPTSLMLRLPGDLPTAHPGHRDKKSKLSPCCDVSQLDNPPDTHTHTSTFPRWFWVTLMWNTDPLSWLDSFPIWSACDPQEHVIPFIKLEERGQVRKRKNRVAFYSLKIKWSGGSPICSQGWARPKLRLRQPFGVRLLHGHWKRAPWSDALLASTVQAGQHETDPWKPHA